MSGDRILVGLGGYFIANKQHPKFTFGNIRLTFSWHPLPYHKYVFSLERSMDSHLNSRWEQNKLWISLRKNVILV